MKAEQIFPTERLGSGAPGAYIPQGIIDRRGAQAAGGGGDDFFRSLSEFGQMIQTSVRRDMVSTAYNRAQLDIAKAELEMKADPDHRSIPEKFSRSLDDIRAAHADNIPDPVARNMFQRKMLEYGTTQEIKMRYYTDAREGEVQRAHLIEGLDIKAGLIEQTNLNELKTYQMYLEEGNDLINQTVASGNMKADTGATWRKNWREKSAQGRALTSIKNDPFDTLAKLKLKDWKRYFPYISKGDRLEYIDQANTRINQVNHVADVKEKKAEADEKHFKDTMREMARKDIVSKINFPNTKDPIDPYNDIQQNPSLNSKDIEHFLKVVKDNAAAALTGKKSIYEETDQDLYGKWKERIYLRPESIESIDEIWKDHGKGLSSKDVAELTKTWEDRTSGGDEVKSLSLQRAIKALNGLRSQEFFGDPQGLESWTKLNEYSRAVEIYVADHPEAGDKEIMTYVAEITADDQKGMLGVIWDKWSEFITWPLRNFPGSEGTLFDPIIPESEAGPTKTRPLDEKRLKAVEILRNANKAVNEDTIKAVMDQM